MPEIDLRPTEYRKRNPRTGRWQFRDNPRLCFVMMLVALGILAYIFVNRDELSSGVLFGVSAMMAFGAGGLFALWLKDY